MIRVAILTVSDSTHAGERKDISGPVLASRCRELQWELVQAAVVPDDERSIQQLLVHWSDNLNIPLILTTGGTGVALRDVTPEATRAVLHREIPGMGELMRSRGLEQTQLSVLSRGLAGTRNATLIINLPGSPRGAEFSLKAVEALIPHILDLLEGRTEHPCHP